MEMGNESKRLQSDHRTDNSRSPAMGDSPTVPF